MILSSPTQRVTWRDEVILYICLAAQITAIINTSSLTYGLKQLDSFQDIMRKIMQRMTTQEKLGTTALNL